MLIKLPGSPESRTGHSQSWAQVGRMSSGLLPVRPGLAAGWLRAVPPAQLPASRLLHESMRWSTQIITQQSHARMLRKNGQLTNGVSDVLLKIWHLEFGLRQHFLQLLHLLGEALVLPSCVLHMTSMENYSELAIIREDLILTSILRTDVSLGGYYINISSQN